MAISEDLAWVMNLPGDWGPGVYGSITKAEEDIDVMEADIKAAKENMAIEIERAKQEARDRRDERIKRARATISMRRKFLGTVESRVAKEAPMLYSEEDIARAKSQGDAAPVPTVVAVGE